MSAENSFSCQVCKKSFSKKSDLLRHAYEHKERPKLECNECNKKFTTSLALERHTNAHNRAKKSKHSCKICLETFHLKSHLLEHHRQHHLAAKLFTCKICKAEFSWEENLKKHMKTHDVNNYMCPTCNKTFLDATSLRVHSKKHQIPDVQVNQLKCKICAQVFQYDFSYKAHMKSHEMALKAEDMTPKANPRPALTNLVSTTTLKLSASEVRRSKLPTQVKNASVDVKKDETIRVKKRKKDEKLFGDLSMAAKPDHKCPTCEFCFFILFYSKNQHVMPMFVTCRWQNVPLESQSGCAFEGAPIWIVKSQ